MKTINTNYELKNIAKKNKITSINGVVNPMLSITNKYVSYYDVASQGEKYITAPFIISFEKY